MAQQSSTTGAFRKDNSAPDSTARRAGEPFRLAIALWGDRPAADRPGRREWDLSARISQKSRVNTQVPGNYVAQYQVKDDGLPAVDGFRDGEHHHHLLAAGHRL